MPREAGIIVGSWEIENAQSISKSVSGDSESDNEKPAPAKMSIEFSSGGKLTTRTQMGSIDSEKVGRWDFQSYDAEMGVMKVKCNLDGQATEHEIEFVDADTIRWVPPNMAGTTRQIRFVRDK